MFDLSQLHDNINPIIHEVSISHPVSLSLSFLLQEETLVNAGHIAPRDFGSNSDIHCKLEENSYVSECVNVSFVALFI